MHVIDSLVDQNAAEIRRAVQAHYIIEVCGGGSLTFRSVYTPRAKISHDSRQEVNCLIIRLLTPGFLSLLRSNAPDFHGVSRRATVSLNYISGVSSFFVCPAQGIHRSKFIRTRQPELVSNEIPPFPKPASPSPHAGLW